MQNYEEEIKTDNYFITFFYERFIIISNTTN